MPERAGVPRQVKLGRRIAHDYQVSHACGGGPSARYITLNQADSQTLLDTLERASASYDTGSDDKNIEVLHQNGMPATKGSSF